MNIVLFIFLTLYSHFSVAQNINCNYTVQYPQVTAQVLETTQVIQQSISLSRGRNSSSNGCGTYRFYFTKGTAQSYSRQAVSQNNVRISYNLHQNVNANGILKEQPDALSSLEWVELIAPDRSVSYQTPFFISIPSLTNQNFPPKGIYSDNLQVAIWTIKQSVFVFDQVTNLAISLVVPTRLDISLVDEGAPFNANSTSKVFDFGNLAQNVQRSGDLRVMSNTPYQLRISSQNGGVLKKGLDTLAYSFLVNNSVIGLAGSANSPISFATGTGNSGLSGDRFNIVVKITEGTSSKAAGIYEDIISITAIAN